MLVKVVVEEKPPDKPPTEEEKSSSNDYKYVSSVYVGETRRTRIKRFRVSIKTSS